jgi:hypothetical protein
VQVCQAQVFPEHRAQVFPARQAQVSLVHPVRQGQASPAPPVEHPLHLQALQASQ